MPNVLFTHNDRGIKDSPAPGEDTTDAAVWAIGLNGQALARFRLTSGGNPIPYFDTEAISRDPKAGWPWPTPAPTSTAVSPSPCTGLRRPW